MVDNEKRMKDGRVRVSFMYFAEACLVVGIQEQAPPNHEPWASSPDHVAVALYRRPAASDAMVQFPHRSFELSAGQGGVWKLKRQSLD